MDEHLNMFITVVTIFPEMFPGMLAYSLPGKHLGTLWNLKTVNIRNYSDNRWQKVDDTPYGGGAGMVMKPNIIHDALTGALKNYPNMKPAIINMTPRGKLFSNTKARNLATYDGLIILCGRYEGIDQRVIDYWIENHGMEEISIGDYVLFGGEVAATVVIESCLRFIPGFMHNENSPEDESFDIRDINGTRVDLLEYPQYTKPVSWNGYDVPSVLLSGNHGEIAKWRIEQSERITKQVRPDLWRTYQSNK